MLYLPIDRFSAKPLTRQVYEQIRQLILKGQLPANFRMPSTRQLATELTVSRIVILEAYDQLIAEGYLIAKLGSGSFVAPGASFVTAPTSNKDSTLKNPESLSDGQIIDFRSGVPALDLFPAKKWGQMLRDACLETSIATLDYQTPQGSWQARHILAKYLNNSRGLVCSPEQVIFTTGATQALSLIAKLLHKPQGKIIVEDPGNPEINSIFSDAAENICPVLVDGHGLQTDLLPNELEPAFIYITPSHQYPLGGILPIQRRIQLIHYARRTGAYVVEDDYDSEFRYEGSPVSSLQGLAPEHVIYVGTFSKLLSPALRLGYMVLPQPLVKQCLKLKRASDRHSPIIDQLALAKFIDRGELTKHLTKMRKVYLRKRNFLTGQLLHCFPDRIKIWGASTGLHLVVEFMDYELTTNLLDELKAKGLKVYRVEDFSFTKGNHNNKVIIGYSHLNEPELKEGVLLLAQALPKRPLR